jgi:hypothetical protein
MFVLRNSTITVEEEQLKWARKKAAKRTDDRNSLPDQPDEFDFE